MSKFPILDTNLWIQDTWQNNRVLTCKHVLATKLCQAMMNSEKDRWPNKLKETSVSDGTFFQMLLHMD